MEPLAARWNSFKYRGPSSSKDFNVFVEDSYSDLSSLKKTAVQINDETTNGLAKVTRAQMALTKRLSELYEAQRDNGFYCYADLTKAESITFYDRDDVLIPAGSRLAHNTMYKYISLPGTISESLAFRTSSGYSVPDYIETAWEPIYEASDSTGDNRNRALSGWNEEIFERVSVLSSTATATEGYYYVKVPEQLLRRPESNVLTIHPFPPSTLEYRVEYTTTTNPTLSSGGASWNYFSDYIEYTGPTGNVIEGVPARVYFPSTNITALRVHLKQNEPFTVGSDYIYSMGLAHVSLGYMKYSNTSGMCRVVIDKPMGEFASIKQTIVEFSNMAVADTTSNYSTYTWLSSDHKTVYVEVSLATNGTLESGGGNILTHAPQIKSVRVEYLSDTMTSSYMLEPNGSQPDQNLTISSASGGVQFSTFDSMTTHIFWSTSYGDCRVTFDGSLPTATNGHVIEIGSSGIWRKELAAAAKFIRSGGVDVVITASQLKS